MATLTDYREVMREDLAHQALKVIDRTSLQSASIHRLAKEMGCEVEVLYSHFVDRDALVDFLIQEFCRDILRRLDELERTSDPKEDFIQQQLTLYDVHAFYPSAEVLLNDAYLSRNEARWSPELLELANRTNQGIALAGFRQMTSDQDIQDAAEITRTLLMGALMRSRVDEREEGQGALRDRYERAIRTLVRGWQAESEAT